MAPRVLSDSVRRAAPALAAAVGLLGGLAFGLSQPNGTQIPTNNNLQNYLNAQHNPANDAGESINALTEAAVTPETFDPSCRLTFTVIARGGGQNNSFGWYNVKADGGAPRFNELNEFLTCSDGVPTVRALEIRNSPRYEGGRIGFFMASTQGKTGAPWNNCARFDAGFPADGGKHDSVGYLYFSEKRFNEDNAVTFSGPNDGGSFIHLLIMDSKAFPRAFYFGWEDLYGISGNDNDFEDLLTRVEGITCSGGGGPCVLDGGLGICQGGVMQCRSGLLQCVPQVMPRAEACNGLDDDCDGLTDEEPMGGELGGGAPLCPANQVCAQGRCVGACSELGCEPPLQCNANNFCVEPACLNVTCPEGQRCLAGSCRAACEGVVCPQGQACRGGRCVDACDGITCDAEQVCDEGVCVDRCSCRPCADGKTCTDAGTCVVTSCLGVSCPAGEVCQAGACVDACTGATCPYGQGCDAGVCVDIPYDAGWTLPDGGSPWVQPDGGGADGGPGVGGGGGDGGDSPWIDVDGDGIADNLRFAGGCGCSGGGAGLAGWAVLVCLWAARRRRARGLRAS